MYHAGGFNMSRIFIDRSLMLRGSQNLNSKTVQHTPLAIRCVENQQMQTNRRHKVFENHKRD